MYQVGRKEGGQSCLFPLDLLLLKSIFLPPFLGVESLTEKSYL